MLERSIGARIGVAITHRAYDRFIPWSSFKLSFAVLVLSSGIRDRAMMKQPAWAAPISF
ncbi:MAG: hypothetical protein NTX21_04305 [Alphaproteobacteria bacterium]|nr:hypothetical protein [Alphaproteobacteria bacterium]